MVTEQLHTYQIYRYFMLPSPSDPHVDLLVVNDTDPLTGITITYHKGAFLGKGGFARCYEFQRQDTQEVLAAKIIQKSTLLKPRARQKLMSEISIHQKLNHTNVVKFVHSFEDHLNVYILLELCTNSTVSDLLRKKRRLPENELVGFLSQLIEGICYLHSNRIIHRDLKLGNLFLNENMIIKIGDLGLAAQLDSKNQKRKTICGTPNYIAPEILEAAGHSLEADIWSIGIIIYTLSVGRPPFESKEVKDTYKKIKTGIFTIPESCSPSLRNLITRILKKDPSERLTLEQIRQHQFLKNPICRPMTPLRDSSLVKRESNKQLSDNGRMYTNNNELAMTASQDLLGKSPDKLSRNNSCFNTPLKETQPMSNKKMMTPNKTIKPFKDNQTEEDIVYIKKWIDYSNKYGVGYLLSNDAIGVYYNDCSKLVTSGKLHFYYIQKMDKQEVISKYSFNSYPLSLKKKISLLHHFKSYLVPNQKEFHKTLRQQDTSPIYLKRWQRVKHAILFRMNNKLVQVIFSDNTELIVNSTSKTATYFNKQRTRLVYNVNEIMLSENKEVMKRFQYAKQIIHAMTKKQDQGASTKPEQTREKSNFSFKETNPNLSFSKTMKTPQKQRSHSKMVANRLQR